MDQGLTSLVMRMTKMDRLTSVFIPCSLANSIRLSSFRSLSTGFAFTSRSGFPCQPAPTSHHLPLVSDWRRSSRDTRSGSCVKTAMSDAVLEDLGARAKREVDDVVWRNEDVRLRFLPREVRNRLGSFFADFKDVRVSNMNFVRTLPSSQQCGTEAGAGAIDWTHVMS